MSINIFIIPIMQPLRSGDTACKSNRSGDDQKPDHLAAAAFLPQILTIILAVVKRWKFPGTIAIRPDAIALPIIAAYAD